MFNKTNRVLNRVLNGIINKKYATIKGIKFKINKEEASKILAKNSKFFEETNISGESLVVYDNDPLESYYLPFHSLDIKGLFSEYVGEYGIDRKETYTYYTYDSVLKTYVMKTMVTTVTDWFRCQGNTSEKNYPLGTKETQIYAGFEYPRENIEKILATEEIKNMEDIVINEKIKNFEMNMSYALEKMVINLRSLEIKRTKNIIKKKYNAHRSRVHNLDLQLDKCNIKLYSYYLPCFIYHYELNGKKYYKFVNGNNGLYSGQHIYSFWKVFLATFPIGLIFPFFTITQPFLLYSFVLRSLLYGIFTGLPSGLLAKFYPLYSYSHQSKVQSNESSYNTSTFETEDDRIRKLTSPSNNSRLPPDKCHLLGLNPSESITKDDIKKAYYKKIILYHPDHNQNNPEFANLMSQQLNAAYIELLSLCD